MIIENAYSAGFGILEPGTDAGGVSRISEIHTDGHVEPELFKEQPYYFTGCDTRSGFAYYSLYSNVFF